MSIVIKVENLSKSYYLSHKRKERFPTLRDALVAKAEEYGARLLHPFKASSGEPLTNSAGIEEFWALKDISFGVNQGDRVGIIGRNGAGKSTLLKILSRITEPTTGRVSIKGRVASLLEVGTGFHPELTGRENIFLNGAVLGMSKQEIRRKFDEIVNFAEVEKFLDTPVKRYSSGMYVRLAFSVAAHLEPEILIVDEVLAVGDSQFQSKCVDKMRTVSSQGRTVIFVSHNMGIISNFCSRGILLNRGQIELSGDVKEIVGSYLLISQNMPSKGEKLKNRFKGLEDREFVFEKISLNTRGHQVDTLEMGSSLRIDIDYLNKGFPRFLKIGIQIIDSHGNLIAVLSPNQQFPKFANFIKSRGTISCLINSLNLIPGLYSINLQVENQGIESFLSLDSVLSFQVLEKDVYGTGIIPSKAHGVTYFPAIWSF